MLAEVHFVASASDDDDDAMCNSTLSVNKHAAPESHGGCDIIFRCRSTCGTPALKQAMVNAYISCTQPHSLAASTSLKIAREMFIQSGDTATRSSHAIIVGALPAAGLGLDTAHDVTHASNHIRQMSLVSPMGAIVSACFVVSGPVNFSVMCKNSFLDGSM